MSDRLSPKKIAMLGPYGYGSLGDAAILEAMIQNIRKQYPDAQISAIALNPSDTELWHKIPAYPMTRMPDRDWRRPDQVKLSRNPARRFAYWLRYHEDQRLRKLERVLFRLPLELILIKRAFAFLADFDCLMICGGGQLDDYWGGAWGLPYMILKWSLLAKLRGAQLKFVSVGAGPIDALLSRIFFKSALALANYRSYRDVESKQYMAGVGFKRNDPVYPDLAHSLRMAIKQGATPVPVMAATTGSAGGSWQVAPRLVVGVGPMAYFDPRVWPERDSAVYLGYLNKLAEFVKWLIRHEHRVCFFPGDFHFDSLVIEDLINLLAEDKTLSTEGKIIRESIYTVETLLEQLALTDLVIATRFHGVLLSHFMGKPVVALSYHQKIDTLMAAAGQSAYNLSVDTFDVPTLIERFQALAANREAAAAQIGQQKQVYVKALEEQYERIFNQI
ncbi:MAG: polysaccharide pyruvyl transferase family protein [Chloroflexi bacterium]|nr:polysaccharide pyruvyl transferase family protein [Chloroflexota bacterium]